jgi:RND family efflux transporter MFP subunit
MAQANLLEAESSLELAQEEMTRAASLKDKGFSSDAELDAARTQFSARDAGLKQAQAQVVSRESSLALARIRLDYTNLAASSPGYIGERFTDEGALLTVNAPVLSVVTFDRVYVRSTVVERDYGVIRPGMEAITEVDAWPGRQFPGLVARIAPQIEQNSRSAELELEVPNDSLLLKPGMFARINLVLQRKGNARLAPSRALIEGDNGRGLFTVEGQEPTARFVHVTTGIVNADFTEILDPEVTGSVVTLGQHLLTDGCRVILPVASARAPAGGERGRKGERGPR